jgi:hypothetical protein
MRIVIFVDLTSAAANTVSAAEPRDGSASIVRDCWIVDLTTEAETVVEGLSRALRSDAVCRSFAASKDIRLSTWFSDCLSIILGTLPREGCGSWIR